MIEIVGSELNQWDVGRYVKITGIEAEYAHFANKGDSKAVIMGVVDIDAKIPDFLLQTGKQLCVYAVKDGITLESKTFYVKHRERPENYVYEDDQRNYIYELITSAEEAVENAILAVEGANRATEGANAAKSSANLAAENANKSADSANLATKNANEAADKANHTAKSLMVVGSVKGDSIHLDAAIDQFLVGLRIFGKTTQDGTPTPDAPVALVSVGNGGSVTVNVTGDNDAQSMTIATPNGLPGIPVTSGGNYIDADGQRWICDEIDLARGVYVKRTKIVNLYDYFQTYCTQVNNTIYSTDILRFDFSNAFDCKALTPVLCNRFSYFHAHGGNLASIRSQECVSSHSSGDAVSVFINKNRLLSETLEGFKAYLENNETIVCCVITTPIETPLSAEELAAYAALRTYRGNTTVSNDASAHMAIEYVMDAKTYIGRLITGITSPGRVVNVSLPASKWAGSGNLFSQVVSIDGITENSQVNLTPSVEQLTIFYEEDVTFITENDGGVVTVYVIGQKPTNDYTIKASVVEVIA